MPNTNPRPAAVDWPKGNTLATTLSRGIKGMTDSPNRFAVTVLKVGTGHCWVRLAPGRVFATYHPKAPPGISHCLVCGRVVIRGMGRWWSGRKKSRDRGARIYAPGELAAMLRKDDTPAPAEPCAKCGSTDPAQHLFHREDTR